VKAVGDVETGERQRRPRSLERDVGGVIGAGEEVASRVREPLRAPGEMGADCGEVLAAIGLHHRSHWLDRERDLGVLVRA